MASLLLEGEKPTFWRELGATVISPPTGFNRLVFGERFTPVFPSNDPATFWRLRFGVILDDHVYDKDSHSAAAGNATIDFSMAYGLPGKPGYSYTRPFDYFHFEAMAVSNADRPFEDVMLRGLLFGQKYDVGDSYRGIWGLYGGYDYIAPQIYRVSSTAASLGTTFQWNLAKAVALQGSVLGGIGYGAAGNIPGEGDRDYHYGIAPQGLLALRLILGDRAMLDATARGYYISGLGSSDAGGSVTIGRLNMGLTVRIYGRHALGIQYLASSLDAGSSHQTGGTFSPRLHLTRRHQLRDCQLALTAAEPQVSGGENMNRNLIIVVIAIVLAATMVLAEDTRPQENTDETIAYLLAFVAKSDCAFIRNGQSYTDKQASNHMQEKGRYFKDQIVTPEDFIRLAASESLVTGQPYMVRTKEGKELRCDEWLKEVLKEYRKTKKG